MAPIVSKDEQPVHACVDEVGGDEREGDGATVVRGLQVAPQREVEQQWERAVVEALQGGDGSGEDVGFDGQVQQQARAELEEDDEQSGKCDGED
jgi:hypothetical protein